MLRFPRKTTFCSSKPPLVFFWSSCFIKCYYLCLFTYIDVLQMMFVSFNSNTQVSLVEQELLTIPEHPSSSLISSEVRVARSLVFCVVLCRSLFVILSFFCWPLDCLSFFDLRLPITALVSSKFSFTISELDCS